MSKITNAVKARKDSKKKVFVSLYSITRHYGGPEEGGWWYNWYYREETAHVPKGKILAKTLRKWEGKYKPEGNIYSVLGGIEYDAMIEKVPGQFETRHRPRYS